MTRAQAEADVKDRLADYLIGKGINIRKPFKCLNPAHADGHPSMSFDRRRNKVHCFACGADYSIIDLISMDYGTDTGGAFKTAYELYNIRIDGEGESMKTATKSIEKKAEPIHAAEDLTAYFNGCKAKLKENGYTYTRFRGLSDEVAERFMLGLDNNFTKGTGNGAIWDALIIPTSRCTYVARNINPCAEKENRVRKVGPSLPYHMSALKGERPVFIVEGEIDALSIIDAGGEACGLGSTENYKKLLEKLSEAPPTVPLIIALDNDEAGKNAAQRLSKELEDMGVFFIKCNLYGECKDANELLCKDRKALADAIRDAEEDAKKQMEKAKEDEKEAYKATSAAGYLQGFVNGIAESVNTQATPTGFMELDKALDGGLYEGLYTCGAISSLGKTTLILQVADQVAQGGKDVLIFSLEMARNELMSKSISRHTIITALDLGLDTRNAKTSRGITCGARYARYSAEERGLINDAIKIYSKYADHVYIIEGVGDIGAEGIRESVQKHISLTGNIPVVVVDYLQMLAPADVRASDKQNTDKAILELKRISRDFKLPVIAISSFNRDSYTNEATMAAFKESGAIEYGSDVLFGLQLKGVGEKGFDVNEAKDKNPREVELVILKNRNGKTGSRLTFNYYPPFNYFEECI